MIHLEAKFAYRVVKSVGALSGLVLKKASFDTFTSSSRYQYPPYDPASTRARSGDLLASVTFRREHDR
jgi:hypothetical protein